MAKPGSPLLPHRLATDALLTALALALYFLEAQLPPLVPVPGIKLGLANIVTLFALFYLGVRDAFLILLCRILLGSLFGGQLISLAFSLCGGLLSLLVCCLMKPLLSPKQIWVAGVFGALAHNGGQLLAASLLLGRREVLAYFPLLIISGILCGFFTGLCTQELIRRLKMR